MMLNLVTVGRRATQCTSTYVSSQVPMPYVHLISFLVNLFQLLLAMITGVLAFGYAEDKPEEAITQCLIFLVSCVLYQGVLELCEKISNPLGNDDVDFPMFA